AVFRVRGLMSLLYMGDDVSLLDAEKCYEQVKRINELLPRLPDAQLPVPRDTLRVGAARAALWAGHVDEGLADLQALRDECRRRAPPAQRLLAWCSAVEGHWRPWKGGPGRAEGQLTEALRLTANGPPDQDGILLNYFVRGYLARALSDRGAWAEAEEVARAGLLPPSKVTSKVTPDLVYLHYFMLLEITGTLCRQTRFAEAESLLQPHRRELAATGCAPRVLLALQKESGKVLARAGKASEVAPTKRARPLPAGSRALGPPHRRNNRAIWARVVRGGISPMHTAAKRSSCSRRKVSRSILAKRHRSNRGVVPTTTSTWERT